MNTQTILIKAGGSILHEAQKIADLCANIKIIQQAGFKVILVHGGSKAINAALAKHKVPSEFIDGLRVTSKAAIKIIEKVLCEEVNALLVNQLNNLGMEALGVSGAYQQMLLCDYYSKQHGFVGEIKAVNTSWIQELEANKIPIISTIGVDKEGHPLNVNADMAASHIANALQVHKLIYLTDQEGIYDSKGNLFSDLSAQNLEMLIKKSIVSGGMLVKVQSILTSLKAGLNNILILNGNCKNALLEVIFNKKKMGTLCKVTFQEAVA